MNRNRRKDRPRLALIAFALLACLACIACAACANRHERAKAETIKPELRVIR